MYTLSTGTFWQFIQSFFVLVGGALRLDPGAFAAVQTDHGASLLTLVILILGGISVALGQSVILLANKVTPWRFVISLFLNGVLFVVGVLIWAAIFEVVGRFVFGQDSSFSQLGRAIGLAYAPYLFGFFILLPYMGSFLDHFLDVWSFLAILLALAVTLHLDFWQALASALIGLIIIQALKYTIGRPAVALERWLRKVVAGTPLSGHVQELLGVAGEKMTDGNKGGTH